MDKIKINKRESNYEIMKRQTQAKFAALNLDEISSEWELEQIDGFLLLDFVGRRYSIDRATGGMFYELDGVQMEADYNVSMTLMDILTRKRQYAAGTVLPIRSFSTLHNATAAPSGPFSQTAQKFEHRTAELADACVRLGGTPYGKGDAGFMIPVFRDFYVVVQFWDSDEDFGPELNLFCDANALHYMHYETMMFMLCHVLERVGENIKALP